MEASSIARPGAPPRGLRVAPRLLARLSDERLVEQLRRGNDAAFEVIYDRHHRGILAFCRHMLGSHEEAEDAVQHTFLSAHASLVGSDRPIRLKPWLYTIARNRSLSVLRARREQAQLPEEVATAGLSDAVLERDDLRRVLADVQRLPEDQRAALVLAELGDLSHAEVADVVGCEAAKVKALVFQARSSLIESRHAREIPCHEIREQLATASGAALRRGPLRRHLRACPGCAEFRDEVRSQRNLLALALPVIPTAGLKQSVLASVGLGPGAAGGVAAGGAVAGGGAGSGSVAAVGGAGGGVVSAGGAASAGGLSVASAAGATGGGGLISTIAAGTAAKVALVALVAAGGGVAIKEAASNGHPQAGKQNAVHDGATPAGGAGAAGANSSGAAGGAGKAGSAAANRGKGKGAKHGNGKHGNSGNAGSHGRSASHRTHGHGSGSTAGSSGSSTGSVESPSSVSGGGYGGGGSSSPSQTVHGPPAGHPPHPSTPSGSNGHGNGGSNGRHLGNDKYP